MGNPSKAFAVCEQSSLIGEKKVFMNANITDPVILEDFKIILVYVAHSAFWGVRVTHTPREHVFLVHDQPVMSQMVLRRWNISLRRFENHVYN